MAALYRQLLMDDRLNTVFRQAPAARLNFEKLMGIRLSWSGLLTQSATYHIIGLIFIGALILTVGPTWVKQYHQRRRLRER
ncbi:hypothetical protein FD07_GL001697 [Levilactobacillus parabrevis ATCC 53295]|uniref:Uncharacterized protein n=1 Tax=Levilactobacillus parabrevis ATCC 53295 TaxID=1267003 RepID=A0A0R1GST1_9LACO|nr:hypothetical protein FD07_GL001697 [Levilactobacillus parabrevis ATCC 53295]KRO06331.1 hypothetical protein IV61_GL000229 [Levilactobacillus parabrevis]